MRPQSIALAGAAAGAAAAGCWMGCNMASGIVWTAAVSARTAPWQPASASLSARGLVREEAVRGPDAADDEELALKARIPSSLHGLVNLLLRGFCQNADSFARLRHVSWDQVSGADELRILTEEFVVLMGLALRLLGSLLMVVLPLSVIVFYLMSQPFMLPLPAFMIRLAELVSLTLLPLDWLLSPLLRVTARVTGLGRDMELGEEWRQDTIGSVSEVRGRAKRIILGLLVANVLASLATVAALATFVIIVRISGVLGH